MKRKLILCLALVLSGVLFACCNIAYCADETIASARIKITIQEPWTNQTNILYSPAGAVDLINAKETVYKCQTASNQTFEIPVAALVNEKTGNVWAGRKADFYLETDSGIVGITLPSEGVLRWDNGLITKIKSGEKLNEVVSRFETKVDNWQFLMPSMQGTNIRDILNPWFFTRFPTSSIGGSAKIKKYNIHNGSLQLDLESPTGVYKASIWIDIKTRKVVKVIEDDKP